MIIKHKRPLDGSPSKFIVSSISKFSIPENYPILDIPSGFGRNTNFLVTLGRDVISADYDLDVFATGWHSSHGHIHPILLNASKGFPFKVRSFGAIVVVHFFLPNLILNLKDYVCEGGLIIFESYGGNGDNWLSLPRVNEIRGQLLSQFDIEYYKETLVGPTKENVSLKMVARRKL